MSGIRVQAEREGQLAEFVVKRQPDPRHQTTTVLMNGEKRWERPMLGSEWSWGGTLATAGDLVFVGDAAGNLVAHDAEKGDALWHFYTGRDLSASPMTYASSGRQFVALASGSAIFTFALPE